RITAAAAAICERAICSAPARFQRRRKAGSAACSRSRPAGDGRLNSPPARRAVSSQTGTPASCGLAAGAQALQPSAWANVAERLRPPSDTAGGHGAPIPVGNAAAVGLQRWNVAPASSKRNILVLRVPRGLEFPPSVRRSLQGISAALVP